MAEKSADELAGQLERYIDSQTEGLADEDYVAVMQRVTKYVEERVDTKSGAKPTRSKRSAK